MNRTNIIMTYKDGKRYTWTAFRERNIWFLRDHTGYCRALESNWFNSVPLIRLIAENHGMTCNVS